MRKLLTSITILVLMTISAVGQTIDVVSIEESTTDLQARTNPRRDLNGDLCALVKVEFPSIDDLEFGGNTVGTVVYRNGVYNIYVPAGTKRLPYSHNDYYPGEIDFVSAGVKLIGGATYRVKLQRSDDVAAATQLTLIEAEAEAPNILVLQANADKAIDLSATGTANCYIVSATGDYRFKTVQGNTSTSVGAVSSAEVLWETFGTDIAPNVGDLVNTVSYSNGYITFRATGEKGNALIAAKDASGKILWSWHIWCTDKPEDHVYKNNAGTLMDRNLGATSATPGDVGALGLLFQWGRKDPFLGSSSISSSIIAKSTITWPSPVESNSSNGTIAYVTSHPTTFITYNKKSYDWYFTGSRKADNTRWSSSKGKYDPCPPGYRVPDGGKDGVWSRVLNSSKEFTSGPWDPTNKGMDLKFFFTSTTQCWYPSSGSLNYSGGSLNRVGSSGYCWSCSPAGEDAYYLEFGGGGSVTPFNSSSRAYGLSVRCIRE